MQKLIARQHILYESKMYAPCDELPANNASMVEAWLAAKTAVWIDDEDVKNAPKARPRTADPGLQGVVIASESEDGDNLVGKVPKTTRRKKQ